MKRPAAALTWVLVLALGACDEQGDGPDDGEAGDSTGAEEPGELDGADDADSGGPGSGSLFADEVAPLLAASCSCHSAGAGGLAFDGDAYGALVGVPANGADLSYVEPGDVEASYIVHKIRGTQASVGGSGGSMPPSGPLTDAQIETIEAWIEQGALE